MEEDWREAEWKQERALERFWDDPAETKVLNLGCRSLKKRPICRTVDDGLCRDGCGWGGDDSELLA